MASEDSVLSAFADMSTSISRANEADLECLACKGCQWVRQLGRGQYGTAHLVRRDGQAAAAKVVFLEQLKDRDRSLALQEVEVLGRLRHPHVVLYLDSWLHEGRSGQEALVSLMEFCDGGDLRAWLQGCSRRGDCLCEQVVLSLFVQMCAGLRYVHKHKVLHRDIKTSNLLLDAERRVVKIGDFGIARVLEETAAVASTMLGTPYYMSPEVCKGQPYNEKSDMWSLGCVLYEMCVLRHAFESHSLLGLVYNIVSEHYDPIPEDRYSDSIREVVAQLLMKNSEERPTADQALAMEALRPYSGDDGEPLVLPAPVPPPPPPQAPGGAASAPEPPPSPDSSTKGLLLTTPSRLSTCGASSNAPPPPLPAELPPEAMTVTRAAAFPSLRRHALLGPADSQHFESPARPSLGQMSAQSSGRFVSPAKTLSLATPPSRQSLRDGTPATASATPATPVWAQAGQEIQLLVARIRSTLLRRPRGRGNWVLAFARHDNTGKGVLGRAEFSAFLESLQLGLSRREVFLVSECLLAEGQAISVSGFNDALSYVASGNLRFDEPWALQAAGALAEVLQGGLADLASNDLGEVLASLPPPFCELDFETFSVWLPKDTEGAVDWAAADAWRTSAANAALPS